MSHDKCLSSLFLLLLLRVCEEMKMGENESLLWRREALVNGISFRFILSYVSFSGSYTQT